MLQSPKVFYLVSTRINKNSPKAKLISNLPAREFVCSSLEEACDIMETYAHDINKEIPKSTIARLTEETIEDLEMEDELDSLYDIFVIDENEDEIVSFELMEYDYTNMTIH